MVTRGTKGWRPGYSSEAVISPPRQIRTRYPATPSYKPAIADVSAMGF
jgi:hypothetical protein